MTQIGDSPVVLPRKSAPPSNVYTVLALIALVALIAGISFVLVRSHQLQLNLFSDANLFHIEPKSPAADTMVVSDLV